MSNKNNVVPEDQDEFMEWMRANLTTDIRETRRVGFQGNRK